MFDDVIQSLPLVRPWGSRPSNTIAAGRATKVTLGLDSEGPPRVRSAAHHTTSTQRGSKPRQTGRPRLPILPRDGRKNRRQKIPHRSGAASIGSPTTSTEARRPLPPTVEADDETPTPGHARPSHPFGAMIKEARPVETGRTRTETPESPRIRDAKGRRPPATSRGERRRRGKGRALRGRLCNGAWR